MKSICWFRNDLRVLDNPALHHCCLNSDDVIAIYFLNRKQWMEHNDAPVKINFWFRNLECLQKELKKLNIPVYCLNSNNSNKGFDKNDILLLGASAKSIEIAENRWLFKFQS